MSSHAFARLNSQLRRKSSRFVVQARRASGTAPQKPSAGASTDFRPPWVYRTSALLRVVLIPSVVLYAVLYHDFGENDHVFMPPRRWVERQRTKLFPSAVVEAPPQDVRLSSASLSQDPDAGPSS